MELLNPVINKFVALRPEELERRWICFETDSPVIQNQNAIEGAIEYGLEFAFRGVENAGSFAMLAAGQNQEAGMKDDRRTKGDQNEREQQRRNMSVVRPWSERGHKQGDRGEADKDRPARYPTSACILIAF